jgi:hypothetical protein
MVMVCSSLRESAFIFPLYQYDKRISTVFRASVRPMLFPHKESVEYCGVTCYDVSYDDSEKRDGKEAV